MHGAYGIAFLAISACVLMLTGAVVWGSLTLGAAGRPRIWWILLVSSLTPLLLVAGAVNEVWPYRGLQPLMNHLDYAVEAGSLLFALSFAAHAGKVVSLAKRARKLEDDCATLASGLEGRPQS